MYPPDIAAKNRRLALAQARIQRRLQTGNNPLPVEVRADLEDVIILGFVRDGLSVREIAVKYEVSGKLVRDTLVKNRIPPDIRRGHAVQSSTR
ncbi:hypothetical protein V5R04_15515 [Jonesiaceae bacterium BS-20]|uniref:Helix-turn-helix domain-containing protein n=1 Tax=Jonesiaceae bacterium BS-20 TaxID=3120821 RepID=A0AAU7DUU3_9MICO